MTTKLFRLYGYCFVPLLFLVGFSILPTIFLLYYVLLIVGSMAVIVAIKFFTYQPGITMAEIEQLTKENPNKEIPEILSIPYEGK